MADDDPLQPLDMTAMERVCSDTGNAWLWYCDDHDTHGNADSEDEAHHVAAAHVAYFMGEVGAQPGDECSMLVWRRVPHERVDG
jgi:hypothetical protein